VRATVERLLGDLKLRRVNVAVAIPAGAAIVRRLALPADSLADLERRVGLEAEQQMPARPEDTSVSYQLLDRRQEGDSQTTRTAALNVLFGAAKRSEVAERTASVAGPGRRVNVADVEGLALTNAFTLNYPDQSDSALLVHVGHRATVTCLIERGELIATRGIGIGGPGLPAAIGDLASALRQFASPDAPARVFLSGGAWQAQGLSSRLASELGATVDVLDPIRRIHRSPAHRGADIVGPPFVLAVGLALRRKGDW
jgi:Tfp pilus assembly PilM family ATPase